MSLIARARLTQDRSQATFDVLMRCLAEPGTIGSLQVARLNDDIAPVAWPLLALADVDIAINANGDVTDLLGLLIADVTGAPIRPIGQAWGIALSRATVAELSQICTGDALHPELGARVSVAVRRLEPADGPRSAEADGFQLRLTGPGVERERFVHVVGLDAEVAQCLGRASGVFPAGIDVWLVADDGDIIAIPRSSHVTIAAAADPPPQSSLPPTDGSAETGTHQWVM